MRLANTFLRSMFFLIQMSLKIGIRNCTTAQKIYIKNLEICCRKDRDPLTGFKSGQINT